MDLALVTGAGSGIGQYLSFELCRRGLTVIGVGRRIAALERTAQLVDEAKAGSFTFVSADVTTSEGRARIVDALPGAARLRICAMLAGAFPVSRFEDVSLAHWRQTFALLVEARIFLAQALAERFQRGARILFAKSGSAEKPRKGCIEVCASGAASLMVQRCLALELRDRGVLVSSTKPGFVRTEMMSATLMATPDVMPDIEAIRKTPMISAATCGRYMSWLALDTPDDAFLRDDWNIEDTSHHANWLGTGGLHD